MPTLHLDMSGVQLSFEPMPADIYDGRVAAVTEKTSKEGNPKLTWEFVIEEEPFEGRKVWMDTSLLPQALWKLGQTLEALGWGDEAEITDMDGIDLELEDLLDAECRIVVEQSEYQGKINNQVVKILPAGSAVSRLVPPEGSQPEMLFA